MGVQPSEITKYLRATPFRAFRLLLTDGRVLTIEHPRLMMVGRTTAEVGVRSPDLPAGIYDHTVTVPLPQVLQVEVVPRSNAG